MKKLLLFSLFLCSFFNGKSQLLVVSDSIVITSSKIPLPVKKSVKPIKIITSEDISKRSGLDLSQILTEVTGIQVNGAISNPAKDRSLYVRGANSEYTLILLDGLPINDPSSIGASIDLRQLSVSQLERIEIIKGSHSSLYGSDAVAGVVNLITKKNAEKAIGISGNFELGSFGHVKNQADLSGSINNVSYIVSAESIYNNGLSEAMDTLDSEGFDTDGYIRQSLLAKIIYKPHDDLSISPIFRISDFHSQYDEGAFTDGENQYSGTFTNYGISAQYNRKKIFSRLLYNLNTSDRLFESSFGEFSYLGKSQNLDGFINFNLHPSTNLLLGIFYTDQLVGDSESNMFFSNLAPYSNLIFSYSGFDVEGSFRYNNHSAYGSQSNFSILPSYRFKPNSRLFLSYNTAFKAPNISQLFGPFGANPNLDPQTSTNFEVGVEHSLKNQKLNFSATYFRRKINNVIVYSSMYENRDTQNDNGLEVEIKSQINPKAILTFAYVYLNGEIINTVTDPENGVFNLYKRPKHTISSTLNYDLNEKWSLQLFGQWVDKRTDLYFDLGSFSNKSVSLNPYVIFNSNINYSISKNIRAYVSIRNLTNSNYTEVYGFTTPGINGNIGLSFRW